MTRRTYGRAFGLVFFSVVSVLAIADRHNISPTAVVVCAAGIIATLAATRDRAQRCEVVPLPRPKHLHPAAPIGIHDEIEGVG